MHRMMCGVLILFGVEGTGSEAGRQLQACNRRRERGRIDSRHPDASLVDFEQIRYQGIEIDVRVGEVVEGQFLPVPGTCQHMIIQAFARHTFEILRRESPY